jgi:predicted transcriptional regulator
MGASLHEELPTTEQLELIERFLVAFNKVESYLRRVLQESSEIPFTKLVDLYGNKQPAWLDRSGYQLRIYADLRNALVHMRQEQKQYLSIPLPHVVDQIEQICEALIRPEAVIPKFQKSVHKLSKHDTLSVALRDIDRYAYSQFPIYDSDGHIYGLLTENGITRWLASHIANHLTIVEFDETEIDAVLSREESRSNYKFVSRNRPVLDVVSMFSRQTLLEAILITEDGKRDQELLGIITRWDVQKYLA